MPKPLLPASQTPDWFNAQYNNRVLVPEFAQHLARWQADSAAARTGQPCTLDASYGQQEGETLDIFSALQPRGGAAMQKAPVLVFLHGGYWRSLDKADHSFVAPTFTQLGACVVVPNYALCPGTAEAPVTVPHIALQMVRALTWTFRHIANHGGDPARITVVGHSAGGHLAAMLLACRWAAFAKDLPPDLVKGALSISGLHELDSIMRTPFLQESLRLTPRDALRCSPSRFATPAQGRLCTVAGGNESAEFLRHNRLMQQAWGRWRVPVSEVMEGRNHFSVLEALLEPDHRLHAIARSLLQIQ